MSSFGRKRRDADTESSSPAKSRPSAYDKAMGLLARREHSRRELGRKLGQGGYDPDETGDALQQLERARYQDDDRFAQMLIRNRAGHGYGPVRIRAELQSHGLEDAAIRRWLAEAEQDWDAMAAAQVRRRYGGRLAATAAEQGKRAQFLLRRGFTSGSVRKALAGKGFDDEDGGDE